MPLITCQSQKAWRPNVRRPKAPNWYTVIHRLLVQRRSWVRWVKCGCPHRHPSFTHCHIRRSAHPPFTIVRLDKPSALYLKIVAQRSYTTGQPFLFAQCYGQFGKLKDWWPKLLLSVRRTKSKKSEFTKSSSAIWSATNWATKISSAALLLISRCHQYCIRYDE